MSKRSDNEFIADIDEACQRIASYMRSLDYIHFSRDGKTQDAVIRNLEIIGEAVKNISRSFRSKHPLVVWNDLAKLRDKLIHHYFALLSKLKTMSFPRRRESRRDRSMDPRFRGDDKIYVSYTRTKSIQSI